MDCARFNDGRRDADLGRGTTDERLPAAEAINEPSELGKDRRRVQ